MTPRSESPRGALTGRCPLARIASGMRQDGQCDSSMIASGRNLQASVSAISYSMFYVTLVQSCVQVVRCQFDAIRRARVAVEKAGNVGADGFDALLVHIDLELLVEGIGELGIQTVHRRPVTRGQIRT